MSNKKNIINQLKKLELDNVERKNRYLELLEKSGNDKIFKSIMLFNAAALDSYITQTKNQAHESFIMAKRICYIGFIIIGLGILIGFIAPFTKELPNTFISIVTTSSGIITEIIAATIFVLYGKTLKQFDSTFNRIADSQKSSIELLHKQVLNENQDVDKKKKTPKIIE